MTTEKTALMAVMKRIAVSCLAVAVGVKGVKSDVNNYRPISVIPVVSKVFQKKLFTTNCSNT